MLTNQPEDSERCESVELDNKIRDLIGKNGSPCTTAVTPGTLLGNKNSCPLKIPGKTACMAHSVQDTSRMKAAKSATEVAECTQPSRRKNLTDSLEQKIRCFEKQRKELLEVNQQWDQQFRTMKESYERQVAELKMKLDASERSLSTMKKEQQQLKKEYQQWQRESTRKNDLTMEILHRKVKEKGILTEELQELKKENKVLKEKNALAAKKKEHYECEIKRLNKALQDALKIESSPFPEHCLGKSEECSHKELRTEMEVLKQQVQIYEEDFKEERSDRERLHQEKEELQQINQTSRSQLNRLNFEIKAYQKKNEKLEKQLKQRGISACKCVFGFHHPRDPSTPPGPGARQEPQKLQPDYQWYAPDQFPPDVQHKANGFSSEKKVSQ
ncbi:TNFAIP3-interacting protein 3 [Talpa occidentalis]|uniref:TNFAIP3-interacting protein 3 n=1 Tax=Talpa occidentalis TaxID=50954 RepID=UPI0023F8E396|nr:TNFAIP3-interacting protein 3 [Talpa occidentalis]